MLEVGGTLRLKNMLEVRGWRNAALEEKAFCLKPIIGHLNPLTYQSVNAIF